MSIRIDVSELIEVLNLTPHDQNILLIGKHGIGKSQILTSYYDKKKMPVVPLFLGQMSDPGDLIGLPQKDMDTGQTVFMPPYWWPMDNKPIVLFLDELNRARPELLQSVQDLALNKTLAGRPLPEGSRIISAINAGDEYQLTDLDPALVSRFNIYEFVPGVNDCIAWAHKKKLDERVITFIQKNNSFLDPPKKPETEDEIIEKTPDRRSWERVSNVIKSQQSISLSMIKVISGIVGVNAAMSFKKFVESLQSITPDMVLFHFTKKLIKQLDQLSLQDIIYLNQQLLFWINENIPDMNDSKKKKSLTNLEKYMEYLKDSDRREAIADFFNTLEHGNMDNTRSFFVDSDKIFELLTKYAENVKL